MSDCQNAINNNLTTQQTRLRVLFGDLTIRASNFNNHKFLSAVCSSCGYAACLFRSSFWFWFDQHLATTRTKHLYVQTSTNKQMYDIYIHIYI